MRRLSARWRTTLLATASVAVGLIGASVALVALLGHSLTASGDDLARSRLDDIATLASAGDLPRRAAGDRRRLRRPGGPCRRPRRGAAPSNITAAPRIAGFEPPDRGRTVRTVRGAPDDQETEDYRLWAARASTPEGPVTIYVGTTLESVHEVTGSLTRLLAWGVPVAVALLGLLTWVVVGRALRPVYVMRERQREFVANASHDLQSPLTVIRTELDVAARHPEATALPELVDTVRGETDRMERLVQDLLFLARTDDQPPPEEGLVDLDDVVLEEVARLDGGRIRVDSAGVSAAPVRGTRDELARLVRNLLANAEEHAESAVRVRTSRDNGDVVLEVADDGPGVAPENRDRVFERFYRGDASRSSSGTGLGLAIVRSVAEHHGGTVQVEGSCFEVRLPAG